MNFSLALTALLAVGASAVRVDRKPPRPSLEGQEQLFTITVMEDQKDNVKLIDLETEVAKRRRLNRRRRLGANGKNGKSGTSAPTETPEFFVYADADPLMITQTLVEGGGYTAVGAGLFCNNQDACEGIFQAIFTGVPVGNGCSQLAVGVASVQDAARLTVTCPEFDMIATFKQGKCIDTIEDPDAFCTGQSIGAPGVATPRTSGGPSIQYTAPGPGTHAALIIECCPVKEPAA